MLFDNFANFSLIFKEEEKVLKIFILLIGLFLNEPCHQKKKNTFKCYKIEATSQKETINKKKAILRPFG